MRLSIGFVARTKNCTDRDATAKTNYTSGGALTKSALTQRKKVSTSFTDTNPLKKAFAY